MPKDNLKVTASISIDDLVTALSSAFAEKDNELEACQKELQVTRDKLGEAYQLLGVGNGQLPQHPASALRPRSL